jgi:hypothetical protein
MPLHDWTDGRGWESVGPLWITSLLYWLQERLPPGYRAYLGSVPALTIAAGLEEGAAPSGALTDRPDPDFHAVSMLNPEPQLAVHVYHHGQLIAAVELVSPRNKDRPSSREFYRNRYLGYLWSGVHLMLIDVHRRPVGFSFVEAIVAEMQCRLPTGMPPHAVSWDVGGRTPEGQRFLDGWYRQLAVGEPLPTLPLALTAERVLQIDLEKTYAEAARHAYLE